MIAIYNLTLLIPRLARFYCNKLNRWCQQWHDGTLITEPMASPHHVVFQTEFISSFYFPLRLHMRSDYKSKIITMKMDPNCGLF